MVKLADFGIAKAAEQSDITKVGSVLGTAAYLAPEQARGEPAGPASDMYALGVVAYQLLAGRLPYEAASLTDLARLQESGPPPRLDEVDARRRRRRSPPPSPARCTATPTSATPTPPRWRPRCATACAAARRPAPTGWAADEDTAATRMLTGTGATSAMPRTTQAPPRRRLEPLDEPPTRAPRRAPAPPAAAPQEERRRRCGWFVGLLVVLALAAAGFAGYQALERLEQQARSQLREDVRGHGRRRRRRAARADRGQHRAD